MGRKLISAVPPILPETGRFDRTVTGAPRRLLAGSSESGTACAIAGSHQPPAL